MNEETLERKIKIKSLSQIDIWIFYKGGIMTAGIMAIFVIALVFANKTSDCNNELLARALNTRVSQSFTEKRFGTELEERFWIMGAKPNSFKWTIAKRSQNCCVIKLLGNVNGKSTEGFVWFVDLKKLKIYPDNYNGEVYRNSYRLEPGREFF